MENNEFNSLLAINSGCSKTIEDSFRLTIINESSNLLKDYGEITIDNLIKSETFKEIPIIGTLLSFYKIGIGIREKFIIKKIYKFLFQLKDVLQKDKINFLQKCEEDKNFEGNITEKLLIILDRIDDFEKATIIGNLFKKSIEEKISLNDFLYLSNAIDKIHILDLKSFCLTDNFDKGEELREYWMSQKREGLDTLLVSLGLMYQEIEEDKYRSAKELNFKITYRKSRLGRILIEYAFE